MATRKFTRTARRLSTIEIGTGKQYTPIRTEDGEMEYELCFQGQFVGFVYTEQDARNRLNELAYDAERGIPFDNTPAEVEAGAVETVVIEGNGLQYAILDVSANSTAERAERDLYGLLYSGIVVDGHFYPLVQVKFLSGRPELETALDAALGQVNATIAELITPPAPLAAAVGVMGEMVLTGAIPAEYDVEPCYCEQAQEVAAVASLAVAHATLMDVATATGRILGAVEQMEITAAIKVARMLAALTSFPTKTERTKALVQLADMFFGTVLSPGASAAAAAVVVEPLICDDANDPERYGHHIGTDYRLNDTVVYLSNTHTVPPALYVFGRDALTIEQWQRGAAEVEALLSSATVKQALGVSAGPVAPPTVRIEQDVCKDELNHALYGKEIGTTFFADDVEVYVPDPTNNPFDVPVACVGDVTDMTVADARRMMQVVGNPVVQHAIRRFEAGLTASPRAI